MAKIINVDVRRELERLHEEAEDGILKAESVVEAAKSPDSPLHGCFNWNDADAAHQHRLLVARHLLVSYRVVLKGDRNKLVPVRVSLMSDRTQPGGGYRRVEDVLASEELTEELRKTAIAELEAWRKRYAMLTDLCESVRQAILAHAG